jgi:CHAT domain-containing protein/tetratricopeptide (TPR) repeat protein
MKKSVLHSTIAAFFITVVSVRYLQAVEVRPTTVSGNACYILELWTYSIDKNVAQHLSEINKTLRNNLLIGDTLKASLSVREIQNILKNEVVDSLVISDSYYYMGVYSLILNRHWETIKLMNKSLAYREAKRTKDEIRAKCFFNLSLAYYGLGDYRKMKECALQSIDIEKQLDRVSDTGLVSDYISVVTACFDLNEYSEAINYGDSALAIIKNGSGTNLSDLAALYTNMGISYARLSDYSKATLYLGKAESEYRDGSLPRDERYINLLNSLASTYFYLGRKEKSDEYFRMGYELIKSSYSSLSMNFLNSYAVILGNRGEAGKGEMILKSLQERTLRSESPDSRDYIEVLKNYAAFLSNFGIDRKKSLLFYSQCADYAGKHQEDVILYDQIMLGYAMSLADNNEPVRALGVVQGLIFGNKYDKSTTRLTANPDISSVNPDQWSLSLFKAKYGFLHKISAKSPDPEYLLAAANTSELVVSLIERIRLNISEDESRLILGDRYRDCYLFAIRDFDRCYRVTGDTRYLSKAFEFAEKSKVASLLASTRELKATQLQVPSDIAELEKKLRDDIGYYTERITGQNIRSDPDSALLSEYRNRKLEAVQKRDSLVSVLGKKYPGYYFMKYNTRVISEKKIPSIGGRNINYLNYVVTDTSIYIFLANRKNSVLVTVPSGTEFFGRLNTFRNLLSDPGYSGNARADFRQYQETGSYLYRTLIGPVEKYLISDRLLISPDNILSYIPFETIPVDTINSEIPSYKDLNYLFRKYRISYTYSATFLSESLKKGTGGPVRLLAFAPVYAGNINLDSLVSTRQPCPARLYDLPFARTEAEYVAKRTGGKLFLNDEATESAFKSEAGGYDIIHLAMHTAVNDAYPLYSKMIFSNRDSANDGFLNTYEVYGIPLKARMVVLSSCNTGRGQLHSGEGILSLARGFIYSGSQAVLMSMWEVEDRSGTEVIEDFYRYLRSGSDKSDALRRSRLDYLRNSDMLGSHPYFWASIVIYGNNEPLYDSKRLLLRNSILFILIAAALGISHLKRR